MDPNSSFRFRRVLVGVVVGLVLATTGFYGWVEYRRSQYHDRERSVLSRYHEAYTLCVTAGNPSFACVSRVQTACVADPFWRVAKPFAFNTQVPTDDIKDRCRSGVTAD